MSIDEESFPYDSLLDAMDNELNTEFNMVSAEGFKTFGCSSTFISESSQNAAKTSEIPPLNVSENDKPNDKNVTVLMERFKNTTYTKHGLPRDQTTTISTNTTGLLSRASSLDCVLQHKERDRVFSYQDIHPLHIRRRYQNVESKVGKIIAEHSAEPIKRANRQNVWNDVVKEPVPSCSRAFDEKLMHEHDRLKSLCNYLNERLQEKNIETVRLKQNLDHLRIQLMQIQDEKRDMEIAQRKKKQHSHMYQATEYLNLLDTGDRHNIGTQTGIPTPPTPQPMHPAFLLLTDRSSQINNHNHNDHFNFNVETTTVPMTSNKYLTTKMPSNVIRQCNANYKKVKQSSANKVTNNNNNNNSNNNNSNNNNNKINNNSKSTGPASSERDTATSHSTSSKSNSTSLNSISSSTSVYAGGDRSDTYCITSNDEPNPSYDSRSRRSSFRCSSDSAIEIDAIQMPYEDQQQHEHEQQQQQQHVQQQHWQNQKLQKERLQLFQCRSRHVYNNINANNSFEADFHNNDIIIYKSDNLRDLNGVHGRFRTINVNATIDFDEGLMPIALQTTNTNNTNTYNNNNSNNINGTYFIKNNRQVDFRNSHENIVVDGHVDHRAHMKCGETISTRNCLSKGCLWFLKPCTNCLNINSMGQDTSLFELNLLANQSTFSEPKPR